MTVRRTLWLLILIGVSSYAEDNTTVLGPTNVALQDGANALHAGDAEEGVRLTHLGLSQARNERERQTGQSNLCAGYVLLRRYEDGLDYCNMVLEVNDRHWRALNNRALIYIKMRRFEEADADLTAGEKISPNAKSLQAVRKMYLDATHPVSPSVVIDDRRDTVAEDVDAD